MKNLISSIAIMALLGGSAEAAQVAFTPGSGGNIGAALDGSGNDYPGSVICGNNTLATIFATVQNCAMVGSSGGLVVDASQFTLSVANPSLGLFGSAGPNTGQAVGANGGSSGTLAPLIQTTGQAKIDTASAATVQLVALTSSKVIYVTALDFEASGSTNVTFEYGTGTLCAGGTTALTGAYAQTAQTGVAKGSGLGPIWVIPASNALCMVNSAAVQVSGSVSYAQF